MRWPALLLRKTVAEYLDMSEAAVDTLALIENLADAILTKAEAGHG